MRGVVSCPHQSVRAGISSARRGPPRYAAAHSRTWRCITAHPFGAGERPSGLFFRRHRFDFATPIQRRHRFGVFSEQTAGPGRSGGTYRDLADRIALISSRFSSLQRAAIG